jgi:hypothetical protein
MNNNWNSVANKKKKQDDLIPSHKIIISDELKKELIKNDISIDKWYHKLMMGYYYNNEGILLNNEPILKRLSNEYQKALYLKNIDSVVLIKNELFNHMPEQVWIHTYLTGHVCNSKGVALNTESADLIQLSKEYMDIYNKTYTYLK